MTIIIWQCSKCKSIQVSNSKRQHEMNFCKCRETGMDLEEGYNRLSTNDPKQIVKLKTIDHKKMNIFLELCTDYIEQGFPLLSDEKVFEMYDFFGEIEKEIFLDLVK